MVRIGTVATGASDVRRAAEFLTAAPGRAEREPAQDDRVVPVPAEEPGAGAAPVRSGTPVQEAPGSASVCTSRGSAPRGADRLIALGAVRFTGNCTRPRRTSWCGGPRGNRFRVIGTTHG